MEKKEILKEIADSKNNTTDAVNRMGCREDWYDPYYAMSRVFTDEELQSMSESELNNLFKLADKLTDVFY